MIVRVSAVVMMLLLVSRNPASGETSASGARDVAERAIRVMAGPAWDKARYFTFEFNVERNGKIARSFPQNWDRYTGDYRVQGVTTDGKKFDISMNINSKKGRVWVDGAELSESAEYLDRGYKRFINDTYWLLMPLKMLDPGVVVESAGEQSDACGNRYDVLKLAFERVGLTPGDEYWPWINRATGLVEKWEMSLEGSKDKPREVVRFSGYERFGGLLISTVREMDAARILLSKVEVFPEVPKDAFRHHGEAD